MSKNEQIKDEYKINTDAIVEFYQLLTKKRMSLSSRVRSDKERSQREIQRDIGCSSSTVCRIEEIGRGECEDGKISIISMALFLAFVKYYDLSDKEVAYFVRNATDRLNSESIKEEALEEKLKEKDLEIEKLSEEKEKLIKIVKQMTLEQIDNYFSQKIEDFDSNNSEKIEKVKKITRTKNN